MSSRDIEQIRERIANILYVPGATYAVSDEPASLELVMRQLDALAEHETILRAFQERNVSPDIGAALDLLKHPPSEGIAKRLLEAMKRVRELEASLALREPIVNAARAWRAADIDLNTPDRGRPLLDALADAVDSLPAERP